MGRLAGAVECSDLCHLPDLQRPDGAAAGRFASGGLGHHRGVFFLHRAVCAAQTHGFGAGARSGVVAVLAQRHRLHGAAGVAGHDGH